MTEKTTRRDALLGAGAGLLAGAAGPMRSAQDQQKIAMPAPAEQMTPPIPTN